MTGGMTDWSEIRCERGCDNHPTRLVNIQLGGPTAYGDLTPIPQRFARSFEIEVWDTDLTPVDNDPHWCPAHDAVSETILALGVWEPQETAVLMMCWEAIQSPATFVDFGAQIGWFSTLAATFPHLRVVCIEADPDVCEVLDRNVGRTGLVPGRLMGIRRRIGPRSRAISFPNDDLKIVKIDIEGAEADAIRVLKPEIDAKNVPFILMEVSPCFNDTYPELVTSLMDLGYHAYCLPPKQRPPVVLDQLTDLLPFRIVGDSGEVAEQVASWHQRDVLFALHGVTPWA